jgi:hypothetical protein
MRKLFTLAFAFTALLANSQTIYVNTATGDDSYDGLSASVNGSNGPKKTINAGVTALNSGEILVIESGVYDENVVFNKNMQLVKTGSAAVVTSSITLTDAADIVGNLPVDQAIQSVSVTVHNGSSASDGYLFVAENGVLYLNGTQFTETLFASKNLILTPVGTVTLGGIRMNGNSAVLTLGGDLAISNAIEVNQFNGGFLELSAFDLTLNTGAVITQGSAGSFVRTTGTGSLILQSLSDAATVLPVGVEMLYAPVSIDDANNTAETISLRVRPATNANSFNPDLPSAVNSFVGLEWIMNESGAAGNNAVVRFDYTGNSELNNWSEAQNRLVARNDGSNWVAGTDSNIGEGFASATFTSLGGTFAIYSDFPNSIGEKNSLAASTVFPNPFSNELFVALPVDAKQVTFSLIDLTGKVVSSGNIISNVVSLPTDLASGAYFLSLGMNGMQSVIKVMKN